MAVLQKIINKELKNNYFSRDLNGMQDPDPDIDVK
jgi:hypothetical protein